MDPWRNGSSSAWGIHARPLSFLVHLLGLVAVIFVFIWSIHFRGGLAFNATNKSLIFNVHPVLMILGFIFLASEAILVYKTVPGTKALRKIVHLSIQLVALVLGIVGIYAAFKYHNESNIDNLYSLHSWLGLITIILFGLQWLAGFVTFFFPGLAPSARASFLPWHVYLGLFIYGLALTTAELGILEKLTFLESASTIGRFSTEALFANWLGLILVLLGGFVFLAAVIPGTSREDSYTALD